MIYIGTGRSSTRTGIFSSSAFTMSAESDSYQLIDSTPWHLCVMITHLYVTICQFKKSDWFGHSWASKWRWHISSLTCVTMQTRLGLADYQLRHNMSSTFIDSSIRLAIGGYRALIKPLDITGALPSLTSLCRYQYDSHYRTGLMQRLAKRSEAPASHKMETELLSIEEYS